MTNQEENYIVRSLIWSQAISRLKISEKKAKELLYKALTMPLPDIR